MTEEIKKQIEIEVDDSEINAGIHTYQRFLSRPSHTSTSNRNPDKRAEITFIASREECKSSVNSNISGLAYVITRAVYVRDAHGGLSGSSYRDVDHIFLGQSGELEAHLISCAKEDRRMMISRELQSEAQWKIKEGRTK